MATVTIRNLNKKFGAVEVMPSLSLDIEEGQFVVLVGPSGCGKSTLLRMVAGLETITGGEVRIGERVVNHVAPKDRDIAMVFQSYALYPHMNVQQNMGFSLQLKRKTPEEIDGKIRPASGMLGLQDYLDRFPKQLSGGQRQRVAMGRAIVRDPQVFLFDEPLSNLDAKLRVQMRGEIKSMHQRLKTTTIYVTHDQIEAMTMADKIVVMRDGRIEQEGAPLELYDRPQNVFVAGFIGSPQMNFFDAVAADGRLRLGPDLTLPLPPAYASTQGKVICGVRPENFHPGGPGDLPFAVSLVEPTGAETMVTGKIGSTQVSAVLRERVTPHPGEVMQLRVDIESLHLFDPETEQRIEAQPALEAAE
ncbi:sn-glycerol-3-phosphate ABC transporter ATP-binding protein UgpC [Boseongicola sp. H5]|uniref:ABC transporter ATP-binding protein n=1 Tax=Boseongicola sp. H5 TaxID=2763261 RepID=UPI001D09A5CE|nr:sn-glycerol-3-phosphate ABC transporter ATP-binding protein UgpC [Boseongicola sp. H5]